MDYYCYELVLASDEIGGIHMHPKLLSVKRLSMSAEWSSLPAGFS